MTKRLLFIADYATLAHPARTLELALSVREQYEVHFASYKMPDFLGRQVRGAGLRYHELEDGITPFDFETTWKKNKLPWQKNQILRFVEQDRALIESVKPALVFGDLRMGLDLAAQQVGIPMVNLTSAHWSPLMPTPIPLGDNALSGKIPARVEKTVFHLFGEFILKGLIGEVAAAYRHLAKKPPQNLRQMFTQGDYVFFLDPPFLYSKLPLAANHFFVGSALYSFPIEKNFELPAGVSPGSFLLVSLGSSGRHEKLELLLHDLSQLHRPILLATTGKAVDPSWKSKFPMLYTYDFLPFADLLPKAAFVVSNGGAPMNHLCLLHARPNLMVTGNTDQEMASQTIVEVGCGLKIRASQIREGEVLKMAQDLLSGRMPSNLKSMQTEMSKWNARQHFPPRVFELLKRK